MSELETTTSSEPAKKRWYVLQAFSGFENRVAVTLREYIKLHKMEDSFGEVLVPTEEIVENVGGKRRKTERKFFPGYVLVEMEMNDYTWQLVRSVPRVMGFIGGTADKPAPISKKEADLIHNHSLTLQVRWKKWITKKAALKCLYLSSVVQRQLNLNSTKLRNNNLQDNLKRDLLVPVFFIYSAHQLHYNKKA